MFVEFDNIFNLIITVNIFLGLFVNYITSTI